MKPREQRSTPHGDDPERAMTLQNLSLWDVAIAALLIVVNGAVSVALKLDLERKLAWAAVRTVVQLLAIGYVLGWVFQFDRWFVVLPLMVVMTLIAGFAGAQRGARTYAGQRADSIAVDLGQFVAGGGGGAVRRDPDSSVVRAAICDSDSRHDPRQYAHGRVARHRTDDRRIDRAARPRGYGARARRDALGSRPGAGAAGRAGGHDSDAQPDGGGRAS